MAEQQRYESPDEDDSSSESEDGWEDPSTNRRVNFTQDTKTESTGGRGNLKKTKTSSNGFWPPLGSTRQSSSSTNTKSSSASSGKTKISRASNGKPAFKTPKPKKPQESTKPETYMVWYDGYPERRLRRS